MSSKAKRDHLLTKIQFENELQRNESKWSIKIQSEKEFQNEIASCFDSNSVGKSVQKQNLIICQLRFNKKMSCRAKYDQSSVKIQLENELQSVLGIAWDLDS